MASVTYQPGAPVAVASDTIFCLDKTVELLKGPIWVNAYRYPAGVMFGAPWESREEASRGHTGPIVYRIKVTPRRSSWFS